MKTIACLGDSNTFGFDPQSLWGERYPKDVRWPDRLAAAGFRVHNFGQNGLGVSRVAAHEVMVWQLETVGPLDAVVIMLGSNDLLMGLSAKETARAMENLVSLILEKKAAETVWLIAPPVLKPGTWVQGEAVIEESRRLAEEYRRLAEEKEIGFADAGEWGIPVAYDGVHFTGEGHRRFGEKLNNSLLFEK
ncbi:MAG: lipase [Lachnospiraceae bacterium]|nr:lipase [Lachnospiraceae bacterium]